MIKFATSERSKFSQPMKLPEWGKRHGASQPAQQRAKRNEKNDSSQPQQSFDLLKVSTGLFAKAPSLDCDKFHTSPRDPSTPKSLFFFDVKFVHLRFVVC